MKKTFQLHIEGKSRDRILDAVKHEIRKAIKRDRRRALPPGVHYWDFDCRFGLTQELAEPTHLATLTGLIDAVAQSAGEQFYVEVLVKPGYRLARPVVAPEPVSGDPASS